MRPCLSAFIIALLTSTNVYAQADSIQDLTVVKDEKETSITWGDRRIILKDDTATTPPELTLSLGFNFDFLDGIAANDLYADINADVPFIFFAGKPTKQPDKVLERLGLEVGAYQLKTLSNDNDTINRGFRLIDVDRDTSGAPVINYITITTGTSAKVTRENFGLYFQPKYNLLYAAKKPYESALNLIAHFEWYSSDVSIEYDFDKVLTQDTSFSVPDAWPRPYNTVREVPINESRRFRQQYFNAGFGLELIVIRPSGKLQFKSIVGKNRFTINENLYDYLDAGAGETTSSTNFLETESRNFYMIQTEFLEQKVLGLKLLVEVRGYINSTLNLSRTNIDDLPQFSVSLSKQFSLEKIAELLGVK